MRISHKLVFQKKQKEIKKMIEEIKEKQIKFRKTRIGGDRSSLKSKEQIF